MRAAGHRGTGPARVVQRHAVPAPERDAVPALKCACPDGVSRLFRQFWIVDNYLMSAPDSYKKELPSFPGMYGSFPSVEQR